VVPLILCSDGLQPQLMSHRGKIQTPGRLRLRALRLAWFVAFMGLIVVAVFDFMATVYPPTLPVFRNLILGSIVVMVMPFVVVMVGRVLGLSEQLAKQPLLQSLAFWRD
jgi:hypothetical protein